MRRTNYRRVATGEKKAATRERPHDEGGSRTCMRTHYYVLILYREGTNVRTYVKFLAPAA
jgi:hypothetical protein